MTKLHFTAIIAGLFAAGAAQADQYQTGWKIQGPAFSKHLNGQDVAPVRSVQDVTTTAYDLDKPITVTSFVNGVQSTGPMRVGDFCTFVPGTTDAQREACLQANGGATTTTKQVKRRKYNEVNLELGAEYNRRSLETGHVQKFFGGVVKDSNFRWTGYLGAAYQVPVVETDSWRIDAGGSVMLWRRSILQPGGENVKMRWVVVPLPVLTIENKHWGVGVNVSYAPKMKIGGNVINAADTVMLQMVWSL